MLIQSILAIEAASRTDKPGTLLVLGNPTVPLPGINVDTSAFLPLTRFAKRGTRPAETAPAAVGCAVIVQVTIKKKTTKK